MSLDQIRTKLPSEGLNLCHLSTYQTKSIETVHTGVNEIDQLSGGFPRGKITEVFGMVSSGRTSLLFSLCNQITKKGEFCCLVDPHNTFDPTSAVSTGINLSRLLWIRPKPYIEPVLKTTDLLLQGGGFGLIGVDLSDMPIHDIQRIPYSTWFRFKRAAQNTPTILLFICRAPSIRTCVSLTVQVTLQSTVWSSQLLHRSQICAEIVQTRMALFSSRLGRKQLCSFQSPYSKLANDLSCSTIFSPSQRIGVRGVFRHEH